MKARNGYVTFYVIHYSIQKRIWKSIQGISVAFPKCNKDKNETCIPTFLGSFTSKRFAEKIVWSLCCLKRCSVPGFVLKSFSLSWTLNYSIPIFTYISLVPSHHSTGFQVSHKKTSSSTTWTIFCIFFNEREESHK